MGLELQQKDTRERFYKVNARDSKEIIQFNKPLIVISIYYVLYIIIYGLQQIA
jgi:hypothetical protein